MDPSVGSAVQTIPLGATQQPGGCCVLSALRNIRTHHASGAGGAMMCGTPVNHCSYGIDRPVDRPVLRC